MLAVNEVSAMCLSLMIDVCTGRISSRHVQHELMFTFKIRRKLTMALLPAYESQTGHCYCQVWSCCDCKDSLLIDVESEHAHLQESAQGVYK
jgi:hypothetical protein